MFFSSVLVAPSFALSHVHFALLHSSDGLSSFFVPAPASAVGLFCSISPSSVYHPNAPSLDAVFGGDVLLLVVLLHAANCFCSVLLLLCYDPSLVLLSVSVSVLALQVFPLLDPPLVTAISIFTGPPSPTWRRPPCLWIPYARRTSGLLVLSPICL